MKSTGPLITKPQRPNKINWRRPNWKLIWFHHKREILVSAFVLLVLMAVAFFVTLPDINRAVKYAPGTSIQIFDRNDQLVTTLDGDEEREFIPLQNIPQVMRDAMTAAEDRDFYEHHGLSPRGIGRALLANAGAGRVVEGGSTITQQLAKILFFDPEDRSIIRKMREAVVALQLESQFSKDEILEMYLNQVYFGRGSYGVERASIRYFGHSAKQLTLPEATYLAGVVQQPSYLGSKRHLKQAKERQAYVVNALVEEHKISSDVAQKVKNAPLKFSRSITPYRKYPYYISAVLDLLHNQLDEKTIEKGGLRVYTNLDPAAQQIAENTLAYGVPGAPSTMNQAALASVSVKDGAVVALVGGLGSFWKQQWNAATHGHTMGSSFKPFVYLTGFERGAFTPDSMIEDWPVSFSFAGEAPYEPKNFDNDFLGPMTVRDALAMSRNVCAVRAAAQVGIGYVIDTARRAGLRAKLDPTISLALGASAASPVDMAGAYATFARGGIAIPPQIIRRIEDHKRVLKEYMPSSIRVFQPRPIQQLLDCMQAVVERGTGAMAKLPNRPMAGKTGTSDGARDLWFVGFTPDLVTAVWGGNKDHISLGDSATGGTIMSRVWKRYMQGYYKHYPKIPKGSFGTTREVPRNIWDELLKPTPQANQVEELERPRTTAPAPNRSEDEEESGEPQAQFEQSGPTQGPPEPFGNEDVPNGPPEPVGPQQPQSDTNAPPRHGWQDRDWKNDLWRPFEQEQPPQRHFTPPAGDDQPATERHREPAPQRDPYTPHDGTRNYPTHPAPAPDSLPPVVHPQPAPQPAPEQDNLAPLLRPEDE